MKTPKNKHIDLTAAQKLIKNRKRPIDPQVLSAEILAGNTIALSRAITLIESTISAHQKTAQEILAACLPHTKNALRVGITGVPGVGKSTFIEALGMLAIAQGKKVAVLAVDPSSSISQGSILGDKTRMERLTADTNAFIRPSPAGDALGGVARKTREAISLCEAAGFDLIFIETVGVGQSETAVHQMTDFFLLLKLAGAGDELQGIKRGIIEMADAIVINKADGTNTTAAKHAKTEFSRALHLYRPKASAWQPKILSCSALEETGIDEIWHTLLEFEAHTKANGFFESNRQDQNKYWLQATVVNALKDRFYKDDTVKLQLPQLLDAINAGEVSAFQAAQELLKNFK